MYVKPKLIPHQNQKLTQQHNWKKVPPAHAHQVFRWNNSSRTECGMMTECGFRYILSNFFQVTFTLLSRVAFRCLNCYRRHSTSIRPHSVLTKIPNGFLTVFCQFIVKPYHSSVLPRCQYPNDEDLNICLELRANKLAFGEHQVCVSRT
jgi:hypothetical protein